MNEHVNPDTELLFKALTYFNLSNNIMLSWERFNPRTRDIDNLFREYRCDTFAEYFYDSDLENEEGRIRFNNWQELYFAGNFGLTQNDVDQIAESSLKKVLEYETSSKDRMWSIKIPKEDIPEKIQFWSGADHSDCIEIYYYGRDFLHADYGWTMIKKQGKACSYGICE